MASKSTKTQKSGLNTGGAGLLFNMDDIDEVLAPPQNSNSGDEVKLLPLIDIEPNKDQPRKDFDQNKLDALAASIKEHGVVSPILVTPNKNGTYKIVAGERRWRASKIAELKEIPCIVRDIDEEKVSELALVENLQRDDLNPIEEAEGYRYLIEKFSFTQEDVAKKIGKSRSTIANSLRLNNLCDTVKDMLKENKITQGHARALLTLDSEMQIKIAEKIFEESLTVRQAEVLAQNPVKASEKKKKTPNPMMQKYFKEVEDSLSSLYGTKVKISEGNKKGKIEIEYYSKEDLDRILFELKK